MSDKKKIKEGIQNKVLSDIAGIVRNKVWRKELINLINKYIEHSYRDSIKRISYSISDMDLADSVHRFLALHNTSFNTDLATIIHRYMNQSYSNANGYKAFVGEPDKVTEAINTAASSASKSGDASKANEDQIKLSLINKGIEKKSIVRRRWIIIVIFIIVGIIVIYLLYKSNNKAFKELDDLSIDPPGLDPTPIPGNTGTGTTGGDLIE